MKARKIIMKNEDGTVLYVRFELPKDASLQPFAELENLLKSKGLLKESKVERGRFTKYWLIFNPGYIFINGEFYKKNY